MATAKGSEQNRLVVDEPVAGFPLKFKTRREPIFDLQRDLVRSDIDRALAEDKVVVYLSCPISSRGGGHDGTNVEIAKFVENRLMDRFGERFWVLNPARYQMESREGTGLIIGHAKRLGWKITDLEKLIATVGKPRGGDYMRMWTQVLVENRDTGIPHIGDRFDMYYFLGPQDVAEFFVQGTTQNLTAAIEGYFARKFTTDAAFAAHFGVFAPNQPDWELQRKNFFRFYAVKASVNFSLGSHDEWNIFRLLNERRRKQSPKEIVGAQLGGFFDGRQIDPASTEASVSNGYAE